MSFHKKDVKLYGVWDNVTDEGLSGYHEFPELLCRWSASFHEEYGRARDFHVFETKIEAEKAIKLLTKTFLEQDSKCKIDFAIYELTDPKTVTTYIAKEIKSHKPKKR